MIKKYRGRAANKISALSAFVASCLVLLVFSAWIGALPAQAAARAAIVVEVHGDVSVKKAGGSKTYTAYEDMSLNQGDMIYTGESSSLVLKIADHDDNMTIGENAEVSISDLVDQGGGKVSKFKIWAGSAWTKVKSLVGSEDEFEVETPTAVMGVRGTLLYTGVDPVTGETKLVVGSGVVGARTITSTNAGEEGFRQTSRYVTVYPSQQLQLDTRNVHSDLKTKVDMVNVDDLVNQASPEVIQAIIQNSLETQQENAQLKQKLLDDLNKGIQKPDPQSILLIKNKDDLNKVGTNFDAFIPQLAKEAVDRKKADLKIIDDSNKKIELPLKKIDLNKLDSLDKQAGLDPEVVKLKEQAEKEQLKYVKELQQVQSNQDKLGLLLKQIENERSKLQEANKQTQADQLKAITDQYLSQLSPEERKRFEEAVKKNNGGDVVTTPVSSGGSGHKGSSGGSTGSGPSAPALISPSSAVTSNAPALVVKAPVGTVIKVLNNGVVIAQADGNGDQEVHIPLTSLVTEGTTVYDKLTIVTELNGVQSAAVSVPAITVDTTSGIFLTSVDKQNQSVTANLTMKNFKGTKALYAVEVHLMYDNRLSYDGDGSVPTNTSTVFGSQPDSVQILKQIKGASSSELIYAATSSQPAPGNFEVDGEQPLISIPLHLTSVDTTNLDVKLVSYMVVDQAGNVIVEFDSGNAPVSVPVP
ncbi:FecR domain-containing protein [Paenibacillus rigui]|uniref:FecR domain-containing protein n=1 Tax=Paenibacillus rigui TaxID=554312 RepID=UPI0015C654CF|nr:FecR domain-containing protein [Paenibacillus rigui]